METMKNAGGWEKKTSVWKTWPDGLVDGDVCVVFLLELIGKSRCFALVVIMVNVRYFVRMC